MIDYDKQQEQIDLEALARRIMLRLCQFQIRTEAGSLEDGCVWTERAIARRLHYDDLEAVYRALCWLRSGGYVERRGVEWVKTGAGEETFRDEIKCTRLDVSTEAFKREALTGMDVRGNQSELTRAALPGPEIYNRSDDIMVRICDHSKATREIAQIVGLSFKETTIGIITGQIKICTGCHKIKVHGVKKDRFQHKCKECLANAMRERRRNEAADRRD